MVKAKWEPPFQWGIQDRTSASAKAFQAPLSIPPSPFTTDAGATTPSVTFVCFIHPVPPTLLSGLSAWQPGALVRHVAMGNGGSL